VSPMRRPAVAVLVAALAFLGAFVGSAWVSAAMGLGDAAASEVAGKSALQSAHHQGDPRSGAPLCDDRAASTYGAEPAPLPVDAGFLGKGEGKCGTSLLAADVASSSSHDDLQRAPEPPAESVVLPPTLPLPSAQPPVAPVYPRPVGDVVDDATCETDSPPPKPVPWIH